MPQMSIQQAMALAMQRYQAGQLPQAEAICRQALAQQPDHADALHLLGLLACRSGRNDIGVDLLRRAAAAAPGIAHYHSNLANILRGMGQLPEAIECLQRAIALEPQRADQHRFLGMAFQEQGRLDEAIACYRRSLALRSDEAITLDCLAVALHLHGQLAEAETCYRQLLALRPSAAGYCNLGHLLRESERVDEAIEAYRQAAGIDPKSADAQLNLGNMLREQGRLDEALPHLRTAVELRPQSSHTHGALLYALLFDPKITQVQLREEFQRWASRHAEPHYAQIRPHDNDRAPDRRLRIGYVSPHLRQHVVGAMLLPLLANHDHRQFEIVCYSDAAKPDAMTAQLRACANLWRETSRMGNQQLAELIRQDRIDILVDLGNHTANERLSVFARKPAPVQASYLAYNAESGVRSIDYRVTDRYMDPLHSAECCVLSAEDGSRGGFSRRGNSEMARRLKPPLQQTSSTQHYPSEQPIHLPDCYWCYSAPPGAPPVSQLPAGGQGHVTFASFNSAMKVNSGVIGVWASLLAAVPRSRLVIAIRGGERNAHMREAFLKHGVAPEAIVLADYLAYGKHWPVYERVDIALDSFPCNGGVTSLECLWMGVPVVSMATDRPLGRAGVSILSNLGLTELIAQTPDQYVKIAAQLAGDLPRLAELRRTLRDRMRSSPLMHAPRFARSVEAVYREMWRKWCGG